ncbi:hypothetical protein IT417_01580 [bacterium]|nr:hypothetical protein [bacterium]
MYEKIRNGLLEIDKIPNPPFNTRSIRRFLRSRVESFVYTFVEGTYYSYVHVSQKPQAQKLVLFCHTDHPAFVFKDGNSGLLFGKFQIEQVAQNLPIGIDVYDREGVWVAKDRIIKMKGRLFTTLGKFKAKSNYSARFSLSEEVKDSDKLGMYSADNYLGTYALLHLLENPDVKNSPYDLYFVFNHYEEVLQLGSMKFGMDNPLNLNEEDMIINIDTWREGSDDKLLLQLLEKGCVYGLWSSKENKAEILAKESAKILNLEYEVGTNTGSGDGRILDHFKLTPSLISLGFPRDKYHNISKEGYVGYEVISLSKYESLLQWLEKICFTQVKKSSSQSTNKEQLRKLHDSNFLEESIKLNFDSFSKYSEAVKRGYFFHQNILEKLSYWFKVEILKRKI